MNGKLFHVSDVRIIQFTIIEFPHRRCKDKWMIRSCCFFRPMCMCVCARVCVLFSTSCFFSRLIEASIKKNGGNARTSTHRGEHCKTMHSLSSNNAYENCHTSHSVNNSNTFHCMFCVMCIFVFSELCIFVFFSRFPLSLALSLFFLSFSQFFH